MFSHALRIRCTYTSHTHYIRFTHVNVYVSYASGCANHICFTCGLHMFCMHKTVGICIRTPRQAPIDGSLEAFWDSSIISYIALVFSRHRETCCFCSLLRAYCMKCQSFSLANCLQVRSFCLECWELLPMVLS